MKIDILIPTCKTMDQIQQLITEIKTTATSDFNLIIASNVGLSAAQNRNKALDQSTADYVIMMDDDITGLFKGWDELLVKPLTRDFMLKIVSARLMSPSGGYACMMDLPIDTRKEIYLCNKIPTACIAFRKTPIRFDENFRGSGFEDDDFCKQLGDNFGINNLVKVVHKNEKKNQGVHWEYNKTYYERKWRNWVALYKTLTGGEWIKNSIQSVYDQVGALVFVHSNTAWGGGKVYNDCIWNVGAYKYEHDRCDKIHEIADNFKTQEQQYERGFEYIKKKFDNPFILVIDSDEIWDSDNLAKLKARVIQDDKYASYSCRMHTYIKSPFYRIDPPEPCHPIVVLDSKKVNRHEGIRWNGVKPSICFEDVYMHHFTYVRDNSTKIKEKLVYVVTGDKGKYHTDWVDKYWDKIPDVKNFHATIGAERCWQGLKKIGIEDLPAAVKDNVMVKTWQGVTDEVEARIKKNGMVTVGEYADISLLYAGTEQMFPDKTYRDVMSEMAIISKLPLWDSYWLYDFARKIPNNGCYLEIGSLIGGSLWCVNRATEGKKTTKIAIDSFSSDSYGKPAKEIKALFEENTRGIEYMLIQKLSDAAHGIIPDDSVDLLFIDGSHEYEDVKNDIKNYWPKLREGGVMLGHDFNSFHSGVMRAATEILYNKKLTKLQYSSIFCVTKGVRDETL